MNEINTNDSTSPVSLHQTSSEKNLEQKPSILFVDDEATAVKYFQRAIASLAPVVTAGSVEEGIQLLDAHADSLTVLVSDQRMPGRFGNELLRYARDRYPHMVRILTTAYSEIEYTVDAINEGQIHRYIKKPWEITSLRMELKQALDYADLRNERDQLMNEKLLVRKNQTVSHRIGCLYLLCQTMLDKDAAGTLETYLAGAAMLGIEAPETDWLQMDYADMVAAEAQRTSAFAQTLRDLQLQASHFKESDATLPPLCADAVSYKDGVLLVTNTALLTEYLTTPCHATVSPQQAAWLLLLADLCAAGKRLSYSQASAGIACRIEARDPQEKSASLADWIAQF